MLPEEIKKQLWHFMLKYGGATKQKDGINPKVEYYGCRLAIDTEISKGISKLIKMHGIDYKACSDLEDGKSAGFAGTFATSDFYFNYLYGTLRLKDGTSVLWCVHTEDSMGLQRILEILGNPISINDAIQSLDKRLKEKYFEYSCKVY
jgi:hypothetical protein